MSCLTSCTVTKDSYYFKTLRKDTTITAFVDDNFESKIRQADILTITATSLSKDEDLLFNQAAGEPSNIAGIPAGIFGFLVKPDGTIRLHRLGDVKAEGLTRKQLAAQIQAGLAPFMKDAIVNVNYLNHKVTVMGAVNRPQVLSFPGEQLPLIDVLVSSGDVTPNSKRNDVMVIRESPEGKIIKHIDLENNSVFGSPWYYSKPNDIVYVLEDYEKTNRTERRARIQTTLSLVASSVSLLIIVIDRILR
jgi:polysaccharide export outer membrane protein